VRDSGIPREEIYITSKLPAEAKAYDKGAVVLPKATRTAHIQQNVELAFEISAADMSVLDAMRDTEKHENAMEFRWK
jgi:diketogulonate reductase-like aldo/keto reductase